MGRSLIMHIDEAPWVHGGPSQTGTFGEQLIGDLEKGPWVLVLSIEPGHTSAPIVTTATRRSISWRVR